jgi:hypothetical protein
MVTKHTYIPSTSLLAVAGNAAWTRGLMATPLADQPQRY